jgi:hypothetical protein
MRRTIPFGARSNDEQFTASRLGKYVATADPSPPKPEFEWELLVARLWCVYAGLCHLGSLAAVLVSFLLGHSLSALGPNFAITSLGLVRDIIGITTAVVLFIGSRRARIGLVALIPLNTAYFLFWAVSVPLAIIGIVFGLALYIPPLILITRRSQKFRP